MHARLATRPRSLPTTMADRAVMALFFPSILAMGLVDRALRLARRRSVESRARTQALCESCRLIREICDEEDHAWQRGTGAYRYAPVVYGRPSLN